MLCEISDLLVFGRKAVWVGMSSNHLTSEWLLDRLRCHRQHMMAVASLLQLQSSTVTDSGNILFIVIHVSGLDNCNTETMHHCQYQRNRSFDKSQF